jgi:phosphoribosylformylglycinamidine synthase
VDEVIHRALGLTDEEAAEIRSILGRSPNHLELAMFAVMWSEHCSYKSSRLHLRRLPSEGPGVLVGPGENAGVIDAGDGIAVAVRIESHNHPSAIEPYQGAATGVGGILRDVFTMGARPIAVMDSLRFGPLDDARNRWLLEGVVSGISGYGNSVGVPTVGGEVAFDPCYSGNPLVNVLCLGVMPVGRLVRGRASGVGNLAVLLGSSTGRDGIGGVSVLASAGFGTAAADGAVGEQAPSGNGSESLRPSVQVGDPFEEKRLLEACLELLDDGLVVGIQDLGGAGLTCACSETAARGGTGMDVDVSAVPRREPAMEPYEVMTSESQERMLAIVTPDDLSRLLEVCARWEVSATVVGRVTDGGGLPGRIRVLDGWDGPALADVPAVALADEAPVYDRPRRAPAPPTGISLGEPEGAPLAGPGGRPEEVAVPAGQAREVAGDCGADLLSLVADVSWVYEQYDHQLFLNTVEGPGGDAAVLRLKAPGLPSTRRGLALSTDGNSRWCRVDPRQGAAMTVAEAALNVACAGARPVAAVDCLNLGNPEHPEVMWQLSEVVDGLAEACRALDLPIVGGNVSLYNESQGRDIDPTPVVGVVGLIDRLERPVPGPRLASGERLVLLGQTVPSPVGSRWAVDNAPGAALPGEPLPPLDLAGHRNLVGLVAELVADGVVTGLHDVSDGGLGVALAEMAVRSRTGVEVRGIATAAELFSESPSRVVVCASAPEEIVARARAAGVTTTELGIAGGDSLVVEGLVDVALVDLVEAWRSTLPERLAASS